MIIDQLKKLAAEKAVDNIQSGMIVGLGTGSTVQFALEAIAEKLKNGELKNIRCVPSSTRTESEAQRLGIPLIALEEAVGRMVRRSSPSSANDGSKELTTFGKQGTIKNDKLKIKKETADTSLSSRISPLTSHACLPVGKVSRFPFPNIHSTPIDITIDGADEFAICLPEQSEGSRRIDLIKGGGGALLREKILAQNSRRLIIIVDESKLSDNLGEKWVVPVEVVQFAAAVEEEFLKSLGTEVNRRKNSDGSDYKTDENNLILDSNFGRIGDPAALSIILDNRAGIVEHGLFIGLADSVLCAMSNGQIKIFS